MRLFVSVDLDGLAEEIAAVQKKVADASGVRLTDPETVHVTLKFFEEVEEERIPDLTAELAEAIDGTGVAPFRPRSAGSARSRARSTSACSGSASARVATN
jgi:2'-5' RNA ligase